MRSDIFSAKIFTAIAASLIVGLYGSAASIQTLEMSLTSLVSALVGGVISSLAFSFVVLAQIFKKNSKQENYLRAKYQIVIQSLLADVRLLIWCLAVGYFLPVIRQTNIPFVSYPIALSPYINREQLLTSLEVFIVIASISILFEVCNCMFETFIHDSLNSK